MSDERPIKLDEDGMADAVEILDREGYLPEPSEEADMKTVQLRLACVKYIEDSDAKGDKRTSRERSAALLIGLFYSHLQNLMRRIVN